MRPGSVPLPVAVLLLALLPSLPRDDGRVRRVIESSPDGGSSGETRFDSVYVPAGGD